MVTATKTVEWITTKYILSGWCAQVSHNTHRCIIHCSSVNTLIHVTSWYDEAAVVWWADKSLSARNTETKSHMQITWNVLYLIYYNCIAHRSTYVRRKGITHSHCILWWSSSTSSLQCCCAIPANFIASRRTCQVQQSPWVSHHLFRPSWIASSSLRGLFW